MWKCDKCSTENQDDINRCSECNNYISFGEEGKLWLKELPGDPVGLISLIVFGGFWVFVIIYMFSS